MAYLDESDFTLTDIAAGVLDGDLAVVLNPALSTQDVMNAWRHFVPLVVISQAAGEGQMLSLCGAIADAFCLVIQYTEVTQ